MRKYYKRNQGQEVNTIWFDDNSYRISFTDQDPANSDYQQYLAWVAEGNNAEEYNLGE